MTLELPMQFLLAFALGSLRVLAALWLAPLFGHNAIPMRVRGMFALLVAFATVGQWSVGELAVPLLAGPLAVAVARELLIGVALGTAFSLVFSGIALMGEFASIQGGLGAAAVVDPASGANSLALSTIARSFLLLGFLALEGHHMILRAIAGSFAWAPIGSFGGLHFGALAGAGASIFEVAVGFAAPVTAIMLVVNTGVGILGRAVPQLNLMSVQLPAQIILLLVILLVAANPWLQAAVQEAFARSDAALVAFADGEVR